MRCFILIPPSTIMHSGVYWPIYTLHSPLKSPNKLILVGAILRPSFIRLLNLKFLNRSSKITILIKHTYLPKGIPWRICLWKHQKIHLKETHIRSTNQSCILSKHSHSTWNILMSAVSLITIDMYQFIQKKTILHSDNQEPQTKVKLLIFLALQSNR